MKPHLVQPELQVPSHEDGVGNEEDSGEGLKPWLSLRGGQRVHLLRVGALLCSKSCSGVSGRFRGLGLECVDAIPVGSVQSVN